MSTIETDLQELVALARSQAGAERSVGGDLGFALGHGEQSRQLVDAYRKAAGVPPEPPGIESGARAAYVQGYLTCVRDVASGYLRGEEERVATDPRAIGEAIRNNLNARALLQNAKKFGSVSCAEAIRLELYKESSEASCSRQLKKLRELRLLYYLPSNSKGDGRQRLQMLTELGDQTLSYLSGDRVASPTIATLRQNRENNRMGAEVCKRLGQAFQQTNASSE